MTNDAIEQVSKDLLRQLLSVQIKLGDLYLERELSVRASLIDLASHCVPDYIENCIKSGSPLENQPIDFLTATMCHRILDVFQSLVTAKTQLENTTIPELRKALFVAEGKVAENQRRIEEIALMVEQVSQQPKELELVKAQMSDQELHRIVYEFKQSDTFERDSEALELIGSTGYSRVPMIKEILAKKWNIATAKARSIDECLGRLSNKALVFIELKTQQEQTSSGGRYPHILSMTALGVAVFQELFQRVPITSEYDELVKRHKSPEHTLLILQIADFLENEGYTVERYPKRYLLDGGHYAEPDLEFKKEGHESSLLEVERGGNKSNRVNKWLNLYVAGSKNIYVMTDNKKTMVQIRSEICKVLGTKEGTIYLSNMFELLKGERGADNSIWLDKRER